MARQPNLASQISDLQAEFQRVADVHNWMSLSVPAPGVKGVVHVGVTTPGPVLPSIGLSGVAFPHDMARRVVIDHVTQLTARAGLLLKCALEFPWSSEVDVQEEIREAERRGPGLGWVRWLWYAVPFQHVCRIQHYPQVAATGLFVLKQRCLVIEDDDQTFKARLRFDETTHTIFLDGKPYKVSEPRVFALYRCLADQKGMPITRQALGSRGFRGDKTVRRLLKLLPTALRSTAKSGSRGYYMDLPEKIRT